MFSALGGELWTAAGGEAAGGGPDAAGGAGSDLHSTKESPDVMVTQTKRKGTQRYDLQQPAYNILLQKKTFYCACVFFFGGGGWLSLCKLSDGKMTGNQGNGAIKQGTMSCKSALKARTPH